MPGRDRTIAADATHLGPAGATATSATTPILVYLGQSPEVEPGFLTAINPPSGPADPPRPGSTEGRDPSATLDEHLDALFEQVFAGDATGEQWLELCRSITPRTPLYLRPSTWSEVADRLVGDLGRSEGLDFLAHYEALHLLLAHPAARRHAVRATGSIYTDPATGAARQPTTAFHEVGDS